MSTWHARPCLANRRPRAGLRLASGLLGPSRDSASPFLFPLGGVTPHGRRVSRWASSPYTEFLLCLYSSSGICSFSSCSVQNGARGRGGAGGWAWPGRGRGLARPGMNGRHAIPSPASVARSRGLASAPELFPLVPSKLINGLNSVFSSKAGLLVAGATPSQEASVLSPWPLAFAPKFSEALPTEAARPGTPGRGTLPRAGQQGPGALSSDEAARVAHLDSRPF